MSDNYEKISFEEALQKLEEIVQKMESEELSLDESLKNYQDGVSLVQYCRKLLEEAEFKVEKMTKDGELVNFTDDAENE